MEEMQDYYEVLEVPCDAADEEIKRAWHRKQREYQNDESKITQLNQAYEVLCDPEKRKQYDLNMRFGKQIESIKEKVRNSENLEQRNQHLKEAEKLYQDILEMDPENIDALWNLVEIEGMLENQERVTGYLLKLEKYVEGKEKLEVCHRLGELYAKQKETDKAIECFQTIYKADVTYEEDIIALARLYYEEKENLKAAMLILNDSINRSTDTKYKIIYLCETLRAIRMMKNASYQKVEESLYKKLAAFRTEDEQQNLVNAAALLSCLADILEREDFECFHRIETIIQEYGTANEKLNTALEALQQMAVLMEAGRVHKAIPLFLKESWTIEDKEQFGRLVVNEAEAIKESLEAVKNEAPAYWEMEKQFLDLEKIINENLKASIEFQALLKDRSISSYMKEMMECLLLDGFVALFAVNFFEGKSTEEPATHTGDENSSKEQENRNNIPKLHKKKAEELVKMGKYQEAEAEYDKAIESSGKKLPYYLSKFCFYLFEYQQYGKAIKFLLVVIGKKASFLYWLLLYLICIEHEYDSSFFGFLSTAALVCGNADWIIRVARIIHRKINIEWKKYVIRFVILLVGFFVSAKLVSGLSFLGVFLGGIATIAGHCGYICVAVFGVATAINLIRDIRKFLSMKNNKTT